MHYSFHYSSLFILLHYYISLLIIIVIIYVLQLFITIWYFFLRIIYSPLSPPIYIIHFSLLYNYLFFLIILCHVFSTRCSTSLITYYYLLSFLIVHFYYFYFLQLFILLSNIDCRHPLLFIIIYRYLSSAYSRSLSPSSLVTFLFRCVCRAHDDNIVERLHAIITLVTAFERKIERRSGPKRSIETNDSRISVSPNRMEAKSSQWVKNQRQALGNGNLFILEAF